MGKEFKGNFDCLGENTEKYITFSVPIKKELDNGKIITYKVKCIDSCRIMPDSLSSLVDNLSELTKKSVSLVWKEIILYQNVSISDSKIID